MTTRKTIALSRQTLVSKVMSLLFNMLSRLVITFLPRSKHLLISWLQSPSVVILEPPKIKSDPVCTVSPSISHEVMGPDAMIFVFWMLSQLFHSPLSLSLLFTIFLLLNFYSLDAVQHLLIFVILFQYALKLDLRKKLKNNMSQILLIRKIQHFSSEAFRTKEEN